MKNLATNQKNLLLFGAGVAIGLIVSIVINGGGAFANLSYGVTDSNYSNEAVLTYSTTTDSSGETFSSTDEVEIAQDTVITSSTTTDNQVSSQDSSVIDNNVEPATANQESYDTVLSGFGFDNTASTQMDGFELFGKGLIVFGGIIVVLSVLGMIYQDPTKPTRKHKT